MHKKTAFVVLVALLIVGCSLPEPKPVEKDILGSVVNTPTEILYNDVFLDPHFSSTNITVLGIRVGDPEETVLAKLGEPDIKSESDFGGTKNWGYSKAVKLERLGFIYHMEGGVVTRIIVTAGASELLKGNSVATKTKDQLYATYGVPDRQYFFSFPEGAKPVDALTGRFFVYNQHGFETYLAKENEYQYAFVYPMRKLPTTAYDGKPLTPEEALTPKTPILMTDTTTLCNQGPTYAYEIVNYSCKEYINACEIPDNWIEIDKCENVPPKPAPKPPKTNSTNNTTS